LFGLLAAVVLLVLGGIFSAGGHNFALLMVFFPWAMMLGRLSPRLAWWLPFLLLLAVQFPLYSIILGPRRERSPSFWWAFALVALFHVAGVVWCFALDDTRSWRVLFSWV
jgi:hypothetical protein